MAGVTIAKVTGADSTWGNKRVKVRDITFDSSYPTGGEPLVASDVGLKNIDFAIVTIQAVGGTVNVTSVYYDTTNKKLIAYDETPAEVADTSTLATLVVRAVFFGW